MAFDGTARLYDALYVHGLGKDYATEAAQIAEVILSRRPGARTLLDVACGTALHLEHLSNRFDCVGLDVEGGMLGVARERLPRISFVQGDMEHFELGQRFDAITCLFSSVAYMTTEDNLRSAIASMARHLEPGGVLVVEPFLQPAEYTEGHVSLLTANLPDLKVARMSHSTLEGHVAVIDFHYMSGRDGGPVEHHREQHRLGLYDWATYRAAFESAGLSCEIDEAGIFGRGNVVGVAPA